MLASSIALVRVNIGDMDADLPTFSDDTISAVALACSENINLTSSKLLRSLAAMAAQRASVSMGKISESANSAELTKQAQYFEDLAKAEGLDVNGQEIAYEAIIEEGNTEFTADEILVNTIITNGIE